MAGSSRPKKVLIVDDDEPIRHSLQVLLEAHGFEVETFDSTDAFSQARRPTGDVCLILDQHLTRGTGTDFLASPMGRALRIPVILITGRGDGTLERRARELGAAAYLHKPVRPSLLLETIARVMTGSNAAD